MQCYKKLNRVSDVANTTIVIKGHDDTTLTKGLMNTWWFILGRKWAFIILKKKIQHFALFSKLIKEMSLF